MAKPIEIAFTAIRNHPSVRHLNALHKGMWMTLVQINLLDGMDYSKLKENELTRILGVSVHQWHMARNQVIQSFNGSIGELTEKYQARQKTVAKRGKATRVVMRKRWDKAKLKKLAIENALKPEEAFLSDISTAPVPMQPTKSPPKKPQNIDHIARLAAKNTVNAVKSGAKPVNRLVDKG